MIRSQLDVLLDKVEDAALRADLRTQIDRLKQRRSFGLVFEQHIPERVRLPQHPIRVGTQVVSRDDDDSPTWEVIATDHGVATLVQVRDADGAYVQRSEHGVGGPEQAPLDSLVVISDFGEPVLPGLRHLGLIERGGDLYLSYYLRRHRAEYYDRLMAVRLDGDWEGWLRFFLHGVAETADEATGTAEDILRLRDEHRSLVHDLGTNALHMLDVLYARPVINVAAVRQALAVSWPTANKLTLAFVRRGLLEEVTGQRRNRVFRYAPYLSLFKDAAAPADDELVARTEGGL